MRTSKTILGVLVLALMLTTVSCKDAKKEEATTKTEQTEKKNMLRRMFAQCIVKVAGVIKKVNVQNAEWNM